MYLQIEFPLDWARAWVIFMRTITELSAEANAYEFSPAVSFAKWVHVCSALLRESRVYDKEGFSDGLEHAYILYLRFADLVLNKLCKHPQFPQNRKVWSQLAKMVPDAIDRSTQIKDILLKRRQQQLEKLQRQNHQLELEGKREENDDFIARELSKYESKPSQSSFDRNVSDRVADRNVQSALQRLQSTTSQAIRQQEVRGLPSASKSASSLSSAFPPLPSSKTPLSLSPSISPVSSNASPASPGGTGEIKSVFTTEQGRPLRYVFVPATLRQQFLKLAEHNTKQNLETCGMLCGKLMRNAFFVTDLVVPHQESTPDSCGTTNEEELFEYVDSRDLFIVGWIHTHPSQSCFMSSVDLHTHASYQLMLPEAVAVVCSPNSLPDWGSFRLTDPPGIDVIRRCTQPGFHPHDDAESLYRTPDHYREYDFDLTAVDLRPNQ